MGEMCPRGNGCQAHEWELYNIVEPLLFAAAAIPDDDECGLRLAKALAILVGPVEAKALYSREGLRVPAET